MLYMARYCRFSSIWIKAPYRRPSDNVNVYSFYVFLWRVAFRFLCVYYVVPYMYVEGRSE